MAIPVAAAALIKFVLRFFCSSGKTVFYAVGLAHLLDEETGLLKTLAEAGYTVELVEYK